jgi:hypothetical protein
MICIDEGFTVDENGRLSHKICGDPSDTAWPFPCATSVGNPLRVDPDCGLWVPPYAVMATGFASGSTSTTEVTVPAGFTEIEQAEIDVDNPSDCYAARVIQWVQVDVDLYLPPGADSRAAVRINGNSVLALENPAPASGTEMTGVHWDITQTLNTGTIAAGGSNTFVYPIDVGSGQGGARYGQVRWQVRVLVLAGLG